MKKTIYIFIFLKYYTRFSFFCKSLAGTTTYFKFQDFAMIDNDERQINNNDIDRKLKNKKKSQNIKRLTHSLFHFKYICIHLFIFIS